VFSAGYNKDPSKSRKKMPARALENRVAKAKARRERTSFSHFKAKDSEQLELEGDVATSGGVAGQLPVRKTKQKKVSSYFSARPIETGKSENDTVGVIVESGREGKGLFQTSTGKSNTEGRQNGSMSGAEHCGTHVFCNEPSEPSAVDGILETSESSSSPPLSLLESAPTTAQGENVQQGEVDVAVEMAGPGVEQGARGAPQVNQNDRNRQMSNAERGQSVYALYLKAAAELRDKETKARAKAAAVRKQSRNERARAEAALTSEEKEAVAVDLWEEGQRRLAQQSRESGHSNAQSSGAGE
jgi:hypothetical protein